MQSLRLIQRGTIRTEQRTDSKGIDALVSWDYMGSAEYEFGALGNSLKRIRSSIVDYSQFELEISGRKITVFCKTAEQKEVETAIVNLSKNPPRLKEIAEFDNFCGNRPDCRWKSNTNFWWDINNDFMFWPSDDVFTKSMIEAIQTKVLTP